MRLWFRIAEKLSCPVYELKKKLSNREFREWGAFLSIERANYNQMEVNVARIARDMHNKTYTNKLEIDSFLEVETKSEEDKQKEISMNLKLLQNMVKRAGR